METESTEPTDMGEGSEIYKDMDGVSSHLESIEAYWAGDGGDIEVTASGLRNRAESLRMQAQELFETGQEGSETMGMKADRALADAAYLEENQE